MKSFNSSLTQDEFIKSYLESLDCPRSLTAWILYKEKHHAELASLDWEPRHYIDKVSAQDSLAATKFLSKATFLKTGFNLSAVALEKFREAEDQCRKTNRRLRQGLLTLRTQTIISIAQRKISLLLEPIRSTGEEGSSLFAEEWISSCGWGPGATTRIKRIVASAPHKYDVERHITADLLDFVSPFFEAAYPNFRLGRLEVEHTNKVITVPKNSKTDRTIAIEPGWNLWFQKGLGAMLRRRLRKVGIDLSDQTHNQRLSRLGSKWNSLATVDFSSASDTISIEIVRALLPPDWFLIFDLSRSKAGRISKGQPFLYEKFSSMGNGFTFELESLIFWALAEATSQYLQINDPTISVFGDDVILPSQAFQLYSEVCAEVGFTVNSEKSYAETPFRESCGAFYWNGSDVKPIYFKDQIHETTEVLKLRNAVYLLAHRRNNHCGLDARLYGAVEVLDRHLGNYPYVPAHFGDLGRVASRDKAPPRSFRNGYEGWFIKVWAVLASQREFTSHGLLLDRLSKIGTSEKEYGNSVPFPARLRTSKIRVYVHQWPELGEWF